MTDTQQPPLAERLDWLSIARDYEQAALKGWPGVNTPHYALSGTFKALGDEIERLRTQSQPASVEVAIDSGMSGDAVERAEQLWANLPTGRKWNSLQTHEKALVCHMLERLAGPVQGAGADHVEVSAVDPIWRAIIQNVGYSPHPWDNAREGTLTGVDAAVREIRAALAAMPTAIDGEG